MLDEFRRVCEQYANSLHNETSKSELNNRINTKCDLIANNRDGHIKENEDKSTEKKLEIKLEDMTKNEFIQSNLNLITKQSEEKRAEKYNKIMEKLKKALNTNAWDGRWYRRAFMDDGNMLRKYTKRRM